MDFKILLLSSIALTLTNTSNAMIEKDKELDINTTSNQQDTNNIQQSLINKTLNNKDKIAIDWQNVNKYDWQLFRQNITQSPSARTSAIRALRSLFVGDGAQNFNPQDEAERLARFECANCIGGLISFYAGDYSNVLKVDVKSSEFELFTLIAYYYITSLINGDDISLLQKNLRSLNGLLTILITLKYPLYYKGYFIPRLKNSMKHDAYIPSSFLPNIITRQDWNKAVEMAERIDLAGSLKKLIKGVNVAAYFENNRKYSKQTNNSQVHLNTGDKTGVIHSMFQLLSSGLYKLKESNIESPMTTGYFAKFDKYLRDKQYKNNEALELIPALWDFEKTLKSDELDAWNSINGVMQAKNRLREMQNDYSGKLYTTVLEIFSEIFPELRELYDENYFLNSFFDSDCNSEQFCKVDSSKNYLFFRGSGNSGLGIFNKEIKKNILSDNINNNKYMIWFDKQGNMSLYELTGLQLIIPHYNAAYAKYDNSQYNWRVYDIYGKNSNKGMQINEIFTDNTYNRLKNYAGVAAYMLKKIYSQEFLQYMPHGLVL